MTPPRYGSRPRRIALDFATSQPSLPLTSRNGSPQLAAARGGPGGPRSPLRLEDPYGSGSEGPHTGQSFRSPSGTYRRSSLLSVISSIRWVPSLGRQRQRVGIIDNEAKLSVGQCHVTCIFAGM